MTGKKARRGADSVVVNMDHVSEGIQAHLLDLAEQEKDHSLRPCMFARPGEEVNFLDDLDLELAMRS